MTNWFVVKLLTMRATLCFVKRNSSRQHPGNKKSRLFTSSTEEHCFPSLMAERIQVIFMLPHYTQTR